jgi:hypothetical protein
MKHYGANPCKYPVTLCLAVPSTWDPKGDLSYQDVKRVSADEVDIFFVMCACRDKSDPERMEQWKRHFLSIPTTYMVIDSSSDLHMTAVQKRQDIVKNFQTMKHTCLQMMYNVIHFKTTYEQVHGPQSSKDIAAAYLSKIRFADDDSKVQLG